MESFLFDITHRTFGNQEQFEELLDGYPDSLLLVTKDQKSLISSFKSNCIRYIDMRNEEVLKGEHIVADVMVFDGLEGSYRIVTANTLRTMKEIEAGDQLRPVD